MRINVSRGTVLRFAADGVLASGKVLVSGTDVTDALVVVETDARISDGAKLTMPDVPGVGGCGLADLRFSESRCTRVELRIALDRVDVSTIGK